MLVYQSGSTSQDINRRQFNILYVGYISRELFQFIPVKKLVTLLSYSVYTTSIKAYKHKAQ